MSGTDANKGEENDICWNSSDWLLKGNCKLEGGIYKVTVKPKTG